MNIEHAFVYNLFPAILGIRNAYNSWADCDSQGISIFEDNEWTSYNHCLLGENDKKLMLALNKSGSSHRKFLRQVFVHVNLTLPIFLFSELDTYKVSTVRNSCSTMHTRMRRTLNQDDFEYPIAQESLLYINGCIERYQKEEDKEKKELLFLEIKNMLPSGFLQMASMTFNYETLLNMYQQRKAHRLPQWKRICRWIKKLPMMDLLIEEK